MIPSQNTAGYFSQMPVCDKHLSVEVNSDFSLPDYQPEIRRLLSGRVCVLPTSEYIGNSGAEISGELSYRILYLGVDGNLYSAALGDTYSFSVPFEFGTHSVNTNELTLICTVKDDQVSTRVLGPRKLGIRTHLSCHAAAFSPSLQTPELIGPHSANGVEELIFEADCVSVCSCKSEPTQLSDFIPLDASVDNIRVIDFQSSVIVSECEAKDGTADVKGTVLLKLLQCNDAQSDLPITVLRKLPFSLSVPCEGIDPSFECTAVGSAYDEKIEIGDSSISTELILSVSVTAQKSTCVPYISDAYSTERHTECKAERVNITDALKCTFTNLTQNESFRFDDIGISADAKPVDVCGTACADEVKLESGKLCIRGKSNYSVIFNYDGEYTSKELSAPFHIELDCRRNGAETSGDISCDTLCTVVSCRARSDSERVFIDGELAFSVFAQSKMDIDILSEISFGEALEKPCGELLLCFPEKDTGLWDIAKRYGESERKIRAQNSISEGESIPKKKFLII